MGTKTLHDSNMKQRGDTSSGHLLLFAKPHRATLGQLQGLCEGKPERENDLVEWNKLEWPNSHRNENARTPTN